MSFSAQYLWLVPALPLGAAAIGALTPRSGRTVAATAAIAAMIGSWVLSMLALFQVLGAAPDAARSYANFDWLSLGAGTIKLGWLLDPMTAFMIVMVTFIGTMIFIFSVGYMKEDENFTRFFCFLSLFGAAMLGLLVSNSLLLLFVCWELVGLASYLLIGFWFSRPEAAAAAKKAFITTRIGDLGFFLGILWLNHAHGSLLFYDGGAGCLEAGALAKMNAVIVPGGLALSTAVGVLIFCGAIGKSGQFPLHVWLPDAMEGPTPVSALIHAATMVAAGVFLIARVFPLMQADQALAHVPVHALTVVAAIGAITALMGAVIAVGQNDIKRVLAFSTVSQLGYMMLAIGVGSWVAAIFHLLTHAFFKALLFLGAGSVIHACHHEQDMRKLGGLRGPMKVTFATFAVGTMALAGVPFLFSGFWSKEAILHAAHEWNVSSLPLFAGLIAVVLTAFYMTRLVCETFFGHGPRDHHLEEHGLHESSAVMTGPLVVLAICAVLLGFLGTPAYPWLQSKLTGAPLEGEFAKIFEGGALMFGSIVLVGVGIGLGWWIYGRQTRTNATQLDPVARRAPAFWQALGARLGFDAFYAATFGRGLQLLSVTADFFDRYVWGGAVSFAALLGRFVGWVDRQTDEDGLNEGFDAATRGLRGSGRVYSRSQTGDAHGYLRAVALGFVVLTMLLVWGGAR